MYEACKYLMNYDINKRFVEWVRVSNRGLEKEDSNKDGKRNDKSMAKF